MNSRCTLVGIQGLTAALALASVLGLSGCSLNAHDAGKSHLYLSIDDSGQHSLPQGLSQLGKIYPLNAPTSLPNNPNCYAVNVVGSGISDANGKGADVFRLPSLLAGNTCSYPGVTSIPVQSGSAVNIDLQIPSGPKRIIEMVGVYDPLGTVCGSNLPIAQIPNVEAYFYEMGRAVVDLFSDQSVEIQNTFSVLSANDRTKRLMNCDDGPGPNPSPTGGGPPPQFQSTASAYSSAWCHEQITVTLPIASFPAGGVPAAAAITAGTGYTLTANPTDCITSLAGTTGLSINVMSGGTTFYLHSSGTPTGTINVYGPGFQDGSVSF